MEGRLMQGMRLRELKKREGESFKQIVFWPNSSSTF